MPPFLMSSSIAANLSPAFEALVEWFRALSYFSTGKLLRHQFTSTRKLRYGLGFVTSQHGSYEVRRVQAIDLIARRSGTFGSRSISVGSISDKHCLSRIHSARRYSKMKTPPDDCVVKVTIYGKGGSQEKHMSSGETANAVQIIPIDRPLTSRGRGVLGALLEGLLYDASG